MPKTTLAIDFGSAYIGVALVRHQDGENQPLFYGTLTYDAQQLKKALGPRPQLRRMRRTRKTKKARLRRLEASLRALGLDADTTAHLVRYCRRRGWKSLFGEKVQASKRKKKDEEEIIFRFSREEFFAALEKEIAARVPQELRARVVDTCAKVLNRPGDPFQEVRLIRIHNRGSSRCAWEGCQRVTPRRDNALRDALAQFVYAIIDLDKVRADDRLRETIDAALTKAAELGKRLRRVAGQDPKHERQILLRRLRKEMKPIKELANQATWKQNYENIKNLLDKSQGRNRYCREHSRQYVEFLLQGKPVPFKASLTEKGIVSRRQEVLFQKIWRYLEARLLPLAPEGIDRVIVERVAFDLLAGTYKQRQKLGDKDLEAMYQHGPRRGFENTLAMLKEEFGGLCAYCGQPRGDILEREHILPRREFVFDSYLNLVPACPHCNRMLKAGNPPSGNSLTIHENAYQAYVDYLNKEFKNKPPHLFHTMKKGILKLMCQPERVWEAEQYLALIAKNLSEITGTQRGPRPLARYLCEKLRQHYGKRPQVAFRSGRHTALWREAAYPDFDKLREKEEGGVINHALDALILACKLPAPRDQLEALNLRPRDLKAWTAAVAQAAPPPGPHGVPEAPEPDFITPGFEELLAGNCVKVNLALFNWNRKDKSVHRQDVYGWHQEKKVPTKRQAASELAAELKKAGKKKAAKIIESVIHPGLRATLEAAAQGDQPGQAAAQALAQWLRKSLRGSLRRARFSSHPADQRRRQLLQDFVDGKEETIPAIVGVARLRADATGKADLERVEPATGRRIHRYVADPANIAKIVGYKAVEGKVDRSSPLVLDWRQSWALLPALGQLPPVPEGPLRGRALGQPRPGRKEWFAALEAYLASLGVVEYALVSQGCVLLYEDGSQRYLRNFSTSKDQGGFKNAFLRGIVALRRSPLTDSVIPNKKLG